MALLLRLLVRHGVCVSRSQRSLLYRHAVPMGTSAQEEMNKFWDKNTRLNRPVSPHITIYKWSFPMAMSIAHRISGVGLSGAISTFALTSLVLPGSYPHYLNLIHSLSLGPCIISLVKFGIALPLSYHTYNGVRHLCWDVGKGFRIPEVYGTGYMVVALSVITSTALTFL
ncbi:succinate dehydrogenase cytochrome b560 subunit, mitochondrial [Thalassophryne amazonica]|uniref:succinate dehydrogenase cytochrome b560 subunit, mitochondrial n=1 Tax=Thalassophryne amazonica TaxID=390379 RepID=UPI00147125E5|nr:succinate dehydrogenase cytochrome b560 subunit, mitochondrial [Thalassophryne amazonica]